MYISTLAYTYSRKPPKNIKPRKNVIIQLCNIECDFSVPLTDDRNKEFRDDITGWSEIADNLYIWNYKFITFKLMEQLRDELQLADEAVDNDDELPARIERIKMNVIYTYIFNSTRLKEECKKANLNWSMSKDIEDVANEFITWGKANNITKELKLK